MVKVLKCIFWYTFYFFVNFIIETSLFCRKTPGDDSPRTLVIGHNNVFEVDCLVEAEAVGDHNVFEAKSRVGRGVTVGKGCVLGSLCSVTCPQVRDILY